MTDTHTQIDAILAKDSMETYRRECPNRPFNRDTARGSYLQLLGFELVFEYSMSQPKLHLYVTHFKVASDKPKFRGPPQGKGIKRSQPLNKLARRLLGEIKARGKRKNPPADTPVLDEAPQTQRDEIPHTHVSQAGLASQVQPAFHPLSMPSANSKDQGNGSAFSDKLLRHLESKSKSIHNDSVASQPIQAASRSSGRASSIESEKLRHAHNDNIQTAESNAEASSVANLRKSTSPLASQSMSVDKNLGGANVALQHTTTGDERPTSQLSKPDVNKECAVVSDVNVKITTNPNTTLTETSQTSPDKATSKTGRSSSFPEFESRDPWEGMTKIHKRDVTIPTNQAALFEQHNLRWVPPTPGQNMPQGHVPPTLLSQWNKISYDRNRASAVRELVPATSKSIESRDSNEPSPEASSPSSGSDSEVESDSYSWDGSPERDVRPRQQLPADSSPAERRPPRGAIAQRDSEERNNLQSISETLLVQNSSRNDKSAQDREEVRGVTTVSEVQMEDVEDIARDRHSDFDEESEDSMMESSAPCPLGVPGSQQTSSLSQMEPEISSSGPCLPRYHQEQIQVVETPGGNCSRPQPANAKIQAVSVTSSENLTTPQAKSSSQSRIPNTYASKQTGTQKSHESSNSSLAKQSHEVDIMGTQMTIDSWQPPHETVSPHLGMPVPNYASQSDESSKPFSSHSEVISSIPSGENAVNELDIPNSAQGPPNEHASKPSLKRFASDIDAEEQSPTKRHKTIQQARVIQEPMPGVMFRRQDYIGGSSDHVEAQRIYQKFRSDYPPYEGDFAHFTELCSKLRAIRAKGDLKRSFLWDDFVIQHLKAYQQHMEQTQSQDSKSQGYEEFFASNFSKPSFKKRSLTADGIEIAASQHMPVGHADAATSPVVNRAQAGTSFTGSLADKFSNLQAHSFQPSTQDLQSDTDEERMSVPLSSPTPHERSRWHTPMEHSSAHGDGDETQASIPEAAAREECIGHHAADVVPDAESANAVEVDMDKNAEHSQDVEMTDATQVTKVTKQPTFVEHAQAVEVVEAETVGVAETNEDSRQSENFEMTEGGTAVERSEEEEASVNVEVSEVANNVLTDGGREHSPSIETSGASDLAQDGKDEEGNQNVEDAEDTGVSQNAHGHDNSENAEEFEASESPRIIESDGIQETQEFETADESSHEDDLMDEMHEAASIELGDEPLTSAKVTQTLKGHGLHDTSTPGVEPEVDPEDGHEADPDDNSQAQSLNENWFRSLRHIYQRPSGPVWSDDYNTPFKKWARADQNVLKERQRRGGARIPVDEHGVIQRFKY